MSILTVSTATCDTCGLSQKLDVWEKDGPSGWEKVTLRQRNGAGQGAMLHFLLLCPSCQERALKVLTKKK